MINFLTKKNIVYYQTLNQLR